MQQLLVNIKFDHWRMSLVTVMMHGNDFRYERVQFPAMPFCPLVLMCPLPNFAHFALFFSFLRLAVTPTSAAFPSIPHGPLSL
jgi:hypothetical protein